MLEDTVSLDAAYLCNEYTNWDNVRAKPAQSIAGLQTYRMLEYIYRRTDNARMQGCADEQTDLGLRYSNMAQGPFITLMCVYDA